MQHHEHNLLHVHDTISICMLPCFGFPQMWDAQGKVHSHLDESKFQSRAAVLKLALYGQYTACECAGKLLALSMSCPYRAQVTRAFTFCE